MNLRYGCRRSTVGSSYARNGQVEIDCATSGTFSFGVRAEPFPSPVQGRETLKTKGVSDLGPESGRKFNWTAENLFSNAVGVLSYRPIGL